MDAISTLSAGDGFSRGFQQADSYYRRNAQEDRQEKADAINAQRYTDQQARQDERFEHQKEQDRISQERHNQVLNNQQRQFDEQVRNNRWVQKQQKEAAVRDGLAKSSKIQWDRFINGREVDRDWLKQVRETGNEDLSPFYAMDDNLGKDYLSAGSLLKQLKAGNIEAANSSEGIQLANRILGPQIKKGVGELTAPLGIGKKITDKELVRWQPVGEGGVSAVLKVTYEDGTEREEPVTAGRSSAPDDPVRVLGVDKLLDGLQGRAMIGELFAQPGFREQAQQSYNATFGQKTDLSTQSKRNLNPAIERFAGYIMRSQDEYSDNSLTPEQAYNEAKRIIGGGSASEPSNNTQTGDQEDVINKLMSANPGKDREWAIRYGKHLGKL